MRLPLFGFCEGDLEIFSTAYEACTKIEPIDARASSWQVYDRDGQRISLNIVSRPLSKIWPLTCLSVERIELVESGEIDQRGLEEELCRYLEALGCQALFVNKGHERTLSLPELVEIAIRACNRVQQKVGSEK